jgi:predicted DNA-binding transcriptional regulator YafY
MGGMDRTERFYKIDRLLQERGVVPVDVFLGELEVSPATFKRDLEYLRDRLHAPIIWDRDARGYRFDRPNLGEKYELPGLWFNASEIHALLTMQQLLTSLGPGLLTPHIEPLLARLRLLLNAKNVPVEAFEKRIRIQRLTARAYEPQHFLPVVTAVLQRKRLIIDHYNRYRDETIRREISPQRLNYYQENWYVDAWCHLRNDVRRFALDSFRAVLSTDESAKEVSEDELQAALDSGYGIYSGSTVVWAEISFSSERARWVSREVWHPSQSGWFAESGRYHLRVPYSDVRELLMNILKHIPDVKIISPLSLERLLADRLRAAVAELGGGSSGEPPK